MRRIFNIGLNRAGTTSLTEAMRILGWRSLHYQHAGVRLCDIIAGNRGNRRRLFAGLDSHFDFFADFTGQDCYAELDAQYPGSGFIVTTRNLDTWLDSRERKVMKNRSRPDYRYDFLGVDRDAWTREREDFLRGVMGHFRGRDGDLLVMDIPAGDGWAKLGQFLAVEAPATPFPCLHRLAGTSPPVAADP